MKISIPCLCLLAIFLFDLCPLSAQDLLLKVKKGTAKVGTTVVNEQSNSLTLKQTDEVEVYPGTLLLVRRDVVVVELPAAHTYSYADISVLIEKKKKAGQGNVASVTFLDPMQHSEMSNKGYSIRGSEKEYDTDFFYPFDSMKIIYAKMEFIIGNKSVKILDKVLVVNSNKHDSLYYSTPTDNRFKLNNLSEGNYIWTYKIAYHSIETLYSNSFTVPSTKECRRLKKKIKTYKKNLIGFSPEMQQTLLVEYCLNNRIFIELE
jgi:hypothetical protein